MPLDSSSQGSRRAETTRPSARQELQKCIELITPQDQVHAATLFRQANGLQDDMVRVWTEGIKSLYQEKSRALTWADLKGVTGRNLVGKGKELRRAGGRGRRESMVDDDGVWGEIGGNRGNLRKALEEARYGGDVYEEDSPGQALNQ